MEHQFYFHLMMLIAIILAALWTVISRSLLKAALGLAMTSAILTIVMFKLDSPLAAVFELSVCAGLITAIFVSTISLTRIMTHQEIMAQSKDRMKRFGVLPLIIIFVGVGMWLMTKKLSITLPPQATETDVRKVIWNMRHLDLIGQAIMLLAGVFGVVVLFKQGKEKEDE